jgi:hypothetical protein
VQRTQTLSQVELTTWSCFLGSTSLQQAMLSVHLSVIAMIVALHHPLELNSLSCAHLLLLFWRPQRFRAVQAYCCHDLSVSACRFSSCKLFSMTHI